MNNVAVLGISGRVGRCLVRAIRESPDFALSGALASPTSAALGRDAGEVAQTGPVAVQVTAERDQALAKAVVAIDFTLPDALGDNLAAVEKAGIPLVVGITGLDAARQGMLRRFSERQAILVAPNMSLAVNLLFGLAGRAAAALPDDYDVEILETHHRGKGGRSIGNRRAVGRDRRRRAGRRTGGPRRVRAFRKVGWSCARRDRVLEPAGRRHRRPAPGHVRRHGRNARARASDYRPDDLRLRCSRSRALDPRAAARALRHVRRSRSLRGTAPGTVTFAILQRGLSPLAVRTVSHLSCRIAPRVAAP